MKQSALAGYKVLDVTRNLPGPFCSMILADHGAEVITLEDTRYKAGGLGVKTAHRNKSHVSVNLKTPEGKEIFTRLAKETDVLLEGARPGIAKKLGIDYETVREINPGIIYCAISGFGQTGPLSMKAGHDVNYLGYTGVLDLIGKKDGPPIIPGLQIADLGGGSLNGVIGILLALLARERTGKGQYVDIAMADGALAMIPLVPWLKQSGGQYPKRGDNFLSHHYAFYHIYETSDGKHLALGAVEPHFWKGICDHLGVPEYAERQFDETSQEEIKARLSALFKTKTLAQWEEDFKELDVCLSPVRSYEEAVQTDQFIEREMVLEVNDNNGSKTQAIGIPVKLSDTPGSIRKLAEGFGTHTAEVLKNLGYSEAQIADFNSKGIIFQS